MNELLDAKLCDDIVPDRDLPSEHEDPTSSGSVVLSATMQPAVNVALWANDVPVLGELTLFNGTAKSLGDVTIEIFSNPPAVVPKRWHLAQVGAGQIRTIADLDIKLDGGWLSSLTEAVRGSVVLTALSGEAVVAETTLDIRFLAHNEWAGIAAIPDLVAAFVEPNDPSISRILRAASDLLRAQGKPDGLEGYQATSKARLWEQLAAVWSAVCSLDLRYANPPPSFEQSGQRIRPPRQLVEERLGTCLDLTVLFAACLEHVGFRPLLVLQQGHAFAGAWLGKHDFGASVADDAPGLRTRLALDDLVLFETTLCCQTPAPGFRRACAVGAQHLAADNDAAFQLVIDVHRARQRRILPLGATGGSYARGAGVGSGDATAPVAGPPLIDDAPTLRDDADEREAEVRTPEDRLARWRKRLLDLTARNRLLNLPVTGRHALVVDCPDIAKLDELLAGMRGQRQAAPLKFRPWPPLMAGDDPRNARIHRDRMNEDATLSFATEALGKRELLAGQNDDDLQKSLTDIYRTARAAQQEGGANTLFLTTGALLWRAKGKDRPYRAPLVLIPVTLERQSIRSGFVLRPHDDEARVNTTLLEMLRQEFDIRLPSLEQASADDDAGISPMMVLEIFRLKSREVPGWEVTADVALTNLSFTKFLMWQDLGERAHLLRQSEVARRLMDGAEANGPGGQVAAVGRIGGIVRAGAALDDDPAAAELVCPMEADSSQVHAIAAAARGDSFVLIGPPGTGKSQTITNIIANTIAQGRSVLFVAEKRAALEVVQRRLQKVGLGDFCLDLFSSKASKTAVLDQLNAAQQARDDVDEDHWRRSGEEVAALRHDLNGYVRELHRRDRNGWTPFRAIGCLLRAETGGIPEIALGWSRADCHDETAYQRLIDLVEEAAAIRSRLGELSEHAGLAGIERPDWSPNWQARLVAAARVAVAALGLSQDAARSAVRALGLPPDLPLTHPVIMALDRLIDLLLDPKAPACAWALAEDARSIGDGLKDAATIVAKRGRLAASLRGDWRPSAIELPLDTLLADWREASARWLMPRMSGQKAIRARLATAAVAPVPDDPSADLEILLAMKAKDAELNALAGRLRNVLGAQWRGLETDFAALDEMLAFAGRLRVAAAACAPDPEALLSLRGHLRRLLGEGADLLVEGGSIGVPLRAYREARNAVTVALVNLAPLCGGDPGAVIAEDAPDWPGALAAHLRGWEASARFLRDWCAWRGVVQRTEALGLQPLVSALETGVVAPPEAVRVFEANYARWWIGLAVEDLPRLRGFVAAQHEQRIERFRALDAKLLELAARLCRTRVVRGIPSLSERQRSSEYTLLGRQLVRQRGHLPIRQLFGRMPQAIRRLTPCLMMSPLSVAQYVPADAAAFDLVVFDEASQIPTWDAIGSVGRGRQVIVVGDPKQLPPTRFFERQVPQPGEADGVDPLGDLEDLESILDECIGAGITSIELNWHYRSRHESLIAFSNHTYYGGRLVTFPSPVVRDTAVSYRHVPDGVYARAGARTNQIEARAVVAEVVGLLRAAAAGRASHSIGIVTFNAEQQTLVQDLLDKARRDDPSIEQFFSDDHHEPVLVKNLEGVQGEERDVIIFSLTYGPDATGRVAMNFGPLNQSGGERRLNVAVTRAREALLVFGSLRAEHIDLSRSSALGVTHLKQFLTFAEHGARAFATMATGPLGDFESPFEMAVAERLRRQGWIVHPQIGVSGFRVDLGVVDPDARGAFLAGVECDGATYHSSASARDRDRLRQTVLEGLGWRVLRVWSTDWWTNAQREVERLHVSLTTLLDDARDKRAAEPSIIERVPADDLTTEATGDAQTEPGLARTPVPPATAADNIVLYPEARAPSGIELSLALDPAKFYEEEYRPRLAQLVEAILLADAPIRDERLVQRVARAHGFQRTGRRIRDVVVGCLPRGCQTTQDGDALFIWPPGVAPSQWTVFREPPVGSQLDPADVPIEELAALARRVLDSAGSHEACLRLMRDACGLAHLREAARARCTAAIERAGGTEQPFAPL